MSKSRTNTLHLLGALLTVLATLFLISYNLYRRPDYSPFPLSTWVNPGHLRQLAVAHSPSTLHCTPPPTPSLPVKTGDQLIAALNTGEYIVAIQAGRTWQVNLLDPNTAEQNPLIESISFPEDTLIQSFSPVKNTLAYPSCTPEVGCFIHLLSLDSKKEVVLPAITSTDPTQPIKHIRNVMFDESHRFVSYLTNNPVPNTRIIMDFNGKLIHNIHQLLSNGHRLTFHFYQPDTNLMLFTDDRGNTFHYDPTGIALYINRCSLK